MPNALPLLNFIHHSCYLVALPKALLLFDYFEEQGEEEQATGQHLLSLLQRGEQRPLYIFCSHSHADHYAPIVHSLFRQYAGGVRYIFHEEVRASVPEQYRPEVLFLSTGTFAELEGLKIKAYGSTDIGGSFYIDVEGYRLFHAGDLNNWHWNEEASPEYIAQYEADWRRELARLVADRVELDLLMFPTDLRLGKDYLKGLRELLQVIPVGLLAPMHLNGVMHSWAELEELCKVYHVSLYKIS